MRTNPFRSDELRGWLLGEVLLGAASAAGAISAVKLTVVHGQVVKLLAMDELPSGVAARLACFEPAHFRLHEAIRLLGLRRLDECVALLKALAVVIRSEGVVRSVEYQYVLRVAAELGLRPDDAIAIVGTPPRPITVRRPRQVSRTGLPAIPEVRELLVRTVAARA
jgi:hypothetical protein